VTRNRRLDPINWLAGDPVGREGEEPPDRRTSEPLYWLAGVPRREEGEGPPFPISVVWVVLLVVAWLVRAAWKKVASKKGPDYGQR
jgi:hypothetical protein